MSSIIQEHPTSKHEVIDTLDTIPSDSSSTPQIEQLCVENAPFVKSKAEKKLVKKINYTLLPIAGMIIFLQVLYAQVLDQEAYTYTQTGVIVCRQINTERSSSTRYPGRNTHEQNSVQLVGCSLLLGLLCISVAKQLSASTNPNRSIPGHLVDFVGHHHSIDSTSARFYTAGSLSYSTWLI